MAGKLYRIAADGTQTTVSGINFGMDGIAFDGQKLLGVNNTHYFVITSSDSFVTAKATIYALPNANSFGTSIAPYGVNMAAISNVYGFSQTVKFYVIDIVPTALTVNYGGNPTSVAAATTMMVANYVTPTSNVSGASIFDCALIFTLLFAAIM